MGFLQHFSLRSLLSFLKNISENWKLSVCCSSSNNHNNKIEGKRAHLMTVHLQQSSEIELSLVMRKYSYMLNMWTG